MKDLYSKRAPILSHPIPINNSFHPQTLFLVFIEDILKSLLCTPKPLPMLDGVFLPAQAASYKCGQITPIVVTFSRHTTNEDDIPSASSTLPSL